MFENFENPDNKEVKENAEDIKSRMPSFFERIISNEEFTQDDVKEEYEKDEVATREKMDFEGGEQEDIAFDKYKNCPIENGKWRGIRGESEWEPDLDFVPKKKNPEGKTWNRILSEFNIEHIKFSDGEPDFKDITKGDVEIDSFSDRRDDNFDNADIEMARQRGCSPEEVEKWRKENGYTWHECRDMKTMQKVPSIVHNNITHRGGISEAKTGGAMK